MARIAAEVARPALIKWGQFLQVENAAWEVGLTSRPPPMPRTDAQHGEQGASHRLGYLIRHSAAPSVSGESLNRFRCRILL
jgi:hypothetical protein